MAFKSGFVAVIGKPNVGKSSLVNRLVGEKVSIISPKAQTTRNKIFGIKNGKDYQVVCAFGLIIETFSPTSLLTRLLFPTFGFPITATNPDLKAINFS